MPRSSQMRRKTTRSMVLGSPSTCVQFIPGQDDFGIDACPPGYRWLELLPNGEIKTGLGVLPEIPSGLDLASMGY